MDFRQLKYFVRVAEAKSFTRASELLRVAQPALSNQIQKLEQELREQLFVRHSRGVELTEAGHRLMTHARNILQQVDLAHEDVHGAGSQPEGLIRVGMPRSVSEVLAVKLIGESKSRFPMVAIRLVENFSETLSAQLLDGELDLALTYSLDHSSRLISTLVFRERLYLTSPLHSKMPKRREVDFIEAAGLPLILGSPTQVVRKLLTVTAVQNGMTLNVVHEIDSLQTVLNMVEGELGHTILPLPAATRALQAGTIIVRPINNPPIIRDLHIVYPAHVSTRAQLAVSNLLLELAREYVANNSQGNLIDLAAS